MYYFHWCANNFTRLLGKLLFAMLG